MTTRKCILTGAYLSQDNDSKAHIIPSALGGNIKPKGIISDEANAILNEKFDNPLIKSLSPFMALLGAVPDRGSVQPTRMIDRYGEEYLVKYGAKLKITRPEIRTVRKSDGETVHEIKARTPKEAKTLLGKIRKDYPEISLDIDNVVNNLKYVDSPIEGMLHQRLNIGPNIFFPASFVMASIYSASKGMPIHPKFKQFVDKFDPTTLSNDNDLVGKKATIPPDTFYWVQKNEWFKVPVALSHVLFLFCDAKRKESIFYVELFNLPGVAVILPYDGESDAVFTNGIDILTGDKTEVIFDSCAFDSLKWESTHPWEIGKLDEFFSIAKRKVERVIRIAQERSEKHEIDRLLKEKIKNFDGNHVSSPEERKQIIDVIAAYYERKLLNMLESKMYDEKLNSMSDKNP
jgi:hypothetical protein